MEKSYRPLTPLEFLSTPYKEVMSQYVTPEHKPVEIDLHNKAFPQKFTLHQNNATYEYKPKVIMSGYIVGEPIAFTQKPNLPSDYPRFSPSKENIQKPVFIQANNGLANFSNLSTSVFRNQQNVIPRQLINRGDSMSKSRTRIITSLPVGEPLTNTIRRQDYEKLMNENILLRVENARLFEQNKRLLSPQMPTIDKDRRISELQTQINVLKQQVYKAPMSQGMSSSFNSNMSHSDRKLEGFSQAKVLEIQEILSLCLSKYRQSILEEQKLLVDRFRLQSKNQELDFKKQKLIQSRKQYHQTQRRSSDYEKTQHKHSSPTKENWEQSFIHSHSQRHWRK